MLKNTLFVATLMICGLFLTTGCQQGNFEPTFTAGNAESCKIVQETTKEVSFEQPSVDKSKLDTTKTRVEMVFDRQITDVADDGSATAKITVKELKFYSKGQKGVNKDFDSTRQKDKSDRLNDLIGKSYTIKILPDGTAEAVDVSKISKAAKSREAKALVRKDAIENRHTMELVPEDGQTPLAGSKSWTVLGSTPKGALQPKAFEKEYSLKEIEQTDAGKIATVEMQAVETNKEVEGFDASDGGLGVMGNIFDSTSDYTGTLKYNVTTSKIESYNEKLVSEHVAAEEPKGGDKTKGPDVLTMRFINNYSFELL